MAKALFLAVLVLFFSSIMLVFAYTFDMLPGPAYSLVYQAELSIPFLRSTIPPSLEKFEGTWNIVFAPTRAQSDLGLCAIASGTLHAHAGMFTGTVGEGGSALQFTASTTDDGRLTGTLGGKSSVRKGTLVANLSNGSGRGVWNDQYECSGAIVLTKQEAVSDPVQGTVVAADADADVVRRGATRPLLPGMSLYSGDVIETNHGTVSLGMGLNFGTPVTLSPSMTYKVGQ